MIKWYYICDLIIFITFATFITFVTSYYICAFNRVVLLPLPFIPDSPQFALLQQLKGLSALYLLGIA